MNNLEHKLSDEEIDIIVTKVCDNLEKKLYLNIGAGLMSLIWRAIVIGLIAIAGYGAGIHFFR